MRVPVVNLFAAVVLAKLGVAAALTTPAAHGHGAEPLSARQVAATEPCAAVTVAQARGARYVNASLALACLRSVELDVARDVSLIDFMVPFVNFQSNLAFMKDPPAEFKQAAEFDGVDILGGLAGMRSKVLAKGYANQFEFTTALEQLVVSGRDSHFYLKPALNAVFVFARNVSLVSVSPDGVTVPQIYEENDFISSLANGRQPSAVVTVDGTPVLDILDKLARISHATDLDAGFNMLFPSQGKIAASSTADLFYGGAYSSLGADATVLQLANGESLRFINAAIPQMDFTGVFSGADLHNAVEVLGPIARRGRTVTSAPPPPPLEPWSATAATRTVEERQAFCRPSLDPAVEALRRNWPTPVDSHYDKYAAGYFLDGGATYSDVAVLQLASFGNPNAGSNRCDLTEFHRFIGSFVVRAAARNKTRLIVDVRSNRGGAEGILGDVFDHLFPGVVPDFRWRTRATPTLDWIGNASYVPGSMEDLTGGLGVLVSGLRDPRSANESFPSWNDFFGPVQIQGDGFTRLSARDMHAERARFETDWLPANLTRPLVADPKQDLVVLTDGDCHSSCALLVGWLTRDLGGRTVAVGGRHAPGNGGTGSASMAAVGGTKGAGSYDWDAVATSVRGAARELGITRVAGLPQGIGLPAPQTDPPINLVMRLLNTMDVWKDDDDNGAPVQYRHEPADCRLFYTPRTLTSLDAMWKAVADVAWTGARCVPGSTNTSDNTIRGTTRRPQSSPGSAAVAVQDQLQTEGPVEDFRFLLDTLPARWAAREALALRRAAGERRQWGTVVADGV